MGSDMSGHLKTDELLDRLYGLDQAVDQDVHLAKCEDCRDRWEEMRRVQATFANPAPVSTDFLAAQRRKIYARLGQEPRPRMTWAPALAAAALLAIGIAVYRPASTPAPLHPDAGDAQLFADVYSMEQSVEPSVAAPIHSLFEDSQ
jgi:hypothetical protein